MYHTNPWGTSSSESSPANNPFLESSASNRFPALDDTPQQSFGSPSLYPSQAYSPPLSQFQQQSPYATPSQPQYTQWGNQTRPQSATYNQGSLQGYAATQQQYQPLGHTSYGQQFGQQAYGGQLQPQPQLQAQYTGYIQNQQPPVSPQQYQQDIISQFDPYNGSGGNTNDWGGQTQVLSGTAPSSTQSRRLGPSGQPHPRQFIQTHKVELESWNAATWNQALNLFDELRRSWERRRTECQKHLLSGPYLTADDEASVKGMIKSSESNIDSVTASLLQMQEVHSGYKHSLDASSKQRVKEALNAGLQGLPEWP
ncbi:hypothetical protein JB92DRAFT_2914288 [Gautieria morchelliformis]|nr:hypothetical protein JB92DRAFT_2914288 [Gautieria morchelliformis]